MAREVWANRKRRRIAVLECCDNDQPGSRVCTIDAGLESERLAEAVGSHNMELSITSDVRFF
jgi:hypothetical protein